MIKKILLLSVVYVLSSTLSFADIVHFKDGRIFEGSVVEGEDQVWVDGIGFDRQEILHVKKAPFTFNNKAASNEKSWFEKTLRKVGFKSKEERAREKQLKEIEERRAKSSDALKELRELNKKRQVTRKASVRQKKVARKISNEVKTTVKRPKEFNFQQYTGTRSGNYGERPKKGSGY